MADSGWGGKKGFTDASPLRVPSLSCLAISEPVMRQDHFFVCCFSGCWRGKTKRKKKYCRVCTRSCLEKDPTNPLQLLLWGYPQDAWIDEFGKENVSGRSCWWCIKNNEMNYNRTPMASLEKKYKAVSHTDTNEWKDEFELHRDAIIAMAMAMGKDNLKKAQMQKYKDKVYQDTVSQTKRSRKGTEYTVAVFNEMVKDKPELRKKAELLNCRVKTASGYQMEQRVKVYDDIDGVYRFEESEIDSVTLRKTVNDGHQSKT